MAEADPIISTAAEGVAAVTLPARPEGLRLDPKQTAVVVIDMQNAYASEGGYVDLAGFDIGGAAGVIGKIATVLQIARDAGVQVIYLQNGWDKDYVEAGGPGSICYRFRWSDTSCAGDTPGSPPMCRS